MTCQTPHPEAPTRCTLPAGHTGRHSTVYRAATRHSPEERISWDDPEPTPPARTVLYRPYVGRDPNGRQMLVTLYVPTDAPDRPKVTVAYRADRWDTWGVPIELEAAP